VGQDERGLVLFDDPSERGDHAGPVPRTRRTGCLGCTGICLPKNQDLFDPQCPRGQRELMPANGSQVEARVGIEQLATPFLAGGGADQSDVKPLFRAQTDRSRDEDFVIRMRGDYDNIALMTHPPASRASKITGFP
jgi:hypothetical protein